MCPIFLGSVHNFGRSDDDIFNRCINGLMPNLIKKSWTVSTLSIQNAVQWRTKYMGLFKNNVQSDRIIY